MNALVSFVRAGVVEEEEEEEESSVRQSRCVRRWSTGRGRAAICRGQNLEHLGLLKNNLGSKFEKY